ncbi:hypothetical protein [Halococcus sp. IIIV-5B]|uniref:hypothetical protein n=1 Tax=Halococcus sp. IIIV-5B TaxID=2321230 RepID=UPI0018F7B890|nr:hypothetical protein [Halococcus sp. IIIV-5B]
MSIDSRSSPTEDPNGQREPPENHRRIGFVGPAGVGKTTIATVVANRLGERTALDVVGEATTRIERSPSAPAELGPLGIHWTVVDAPAGTAALERASETLDTAFVVATPGTLDRVARYERVADRIDLDVFLVVNRFEECHREELGAFDGPDLAEYFYEDETTLAGTVPEFAGWTTEALLLESLQPERMDGFEAMAALDGGHRSVVNVEVEDEAAALAVVRRFRDGGYAADFFRCNCRCHDGHVIARSRGASPND